MRCLTEQSFECTTASRQLAPDRPLRPSTIQQLLGRSDDSDFQDRQLRRGKAAAHRVLVRDRACDDSIRLEQVALDEVAQRGRVARQHRVRRVVGEAVADRVLHPVDIGPELAGAGGGVELGDLAVDDDRLADVRGGVLGDLGPVAGGDRLRWCRRAPGPERWQAARSLRSPALTRAPRSFRSSALRRSEPFSIRRRQPS